MSIWSAMIAAFTLVFIAAVVTAALVVSVYLFYDHPVILISTVLAVLFVFITIIFYVRGDAA